MNKKTYISLDGYNNLIIELNSKKEQEKEVYKLISESREREMGGDTENTELQALLVERVTVREQIASIELFCSTVNVIDLDGLPEHNGKVRFGSSVTLLDYQTNKPIKYTILGERESDLKNHIVSYSSPIGQAMLNNSVGDVICIEAPKGLLEFEILDISKKI
ncbi:GreA/GreB family elongation factor [Photobacterium kishitanii]|uniref:Transcription elongation factor GreA/GreB C-terminal domain-containing protein n=1 Tax=Photobacterium kishitanii TaxID=318456 RepID=A0A2T3KMY9_9GAMM|nr:GreA/GreB family elongation factor [Photobacterium kishitanii]PSV01142.1 hypothetical protein C9J27_03725 [Photobacterium kishitanii]